MSGQILALGGGISMLNFARLELFVDVVESKSVTLVAARRYMTQPAVSHTLKSLEEHFAVPLFERRGRSLSLTDEGWIVYRLAKHVIEAEYDAHRMIREQQRGEIGFISTAVGDSMGFIMPELWERFHTHHPMANFSLTIHDSETVLSMVVKGIVDIGICIADEVPDELTAEKLGDMPLLLVANPKHRLAEMAQVRADDLIGECFLCAAGSYHRSYTENRLRLAGVVSSINITQYGNAEQIRSAILRGIGLAFLARSFIQSDLLAGYISELRLEGPVLNTATVLIRRRDSALKPLQQAFWSFLCSQANLIVRHNFSGTLTEHDTTIFGFDLSQPNR